MELHAIVVRTVFAWLFLTLLLRLSGKESVSQLSGRSLVVTLVLSDLIDDMAFAEVPAASFVVAAGTVVLVHAIVSLIATMNKRAYALVEGAPPSVLANGELVRRGMRRERISEKELAQLLRTHGVGRRAWREVEVARVEREGNVSVIRLPWSRPANRADVRRRRSRS